MARPPKRKASEIVSSAAPKGKKQDAPGVAQKKQKTEPTASSTRPRRTLLGAASPPRMMNNASTSMPMNETSAKSSTKTKQSIGRSPQKKVVGRPKKVHTQVFRSSAGEEEDLIDYQSADSPREQKASRITKKSTRPANKVSASQDEEYMIDSNQTMQTSVSVTVSSAKKKAKARENTRNKALEEYEEEVDADGRQFWLMKAEPDSRMEKGRDVKFSIDDLKAATSPEPWDGVRNLEARNNMRAMTKGDLAFFYHSNCKVPGIVGIMEIVQEHTIDESAFDPEHPYYDEKSSQENPKWHVVHVAFRQKFPEIIKLKDLQKFSKDRGQLENMQTLKRTRLSVSKVLRNEWDFIMSLVDEDDMAAASAQNQPQMIANGSEATAKTDIKEGEIEAVNGSVEGMGYDLTAPTEDLATETVI